MSTKENYMDRLGRRFIDSTGTLLRHLGKRAVRSAGRVILSLLAQTSIYWIPIVLIIFGAYLSYAQLYLGPLDVMKNTFSTEEEKVAAFYGSNDPYFIKRKMEVFENYKKIASKWSDGLTDEEKSQVSIHELSWGILAATDRITHDPSNTGGKTLDLDPEIVFKDLKPQFTWNKSEIRVETQSCSVEEYTDEEGSVQKVYTVYPNPPDISYQSLIIRVDTLEGEFTYAYKTDVSVEYTGSECGDLSITTTKEVLDRMDSPAEFFKPLQAYLKSNGIQRDLDIDLAFELLKVYDMKYAGNMYYKKYRLPTEVNGSWAEPIRLAASQYGVPEQIIFNMMMAESSGDPWDKNGYPLRSSAGAIGLMQIMPETAKSLGVDPTDPIQSIYGAAKYLAQLFNMFHDWKLAVAAYNAGPGNVQKYKGVPPFKETIEYVRKVLGDISV